MKTKFRLVLLALVALVTAARADTIGTAFTFSGQLGKDGAPANGIFDLTFTLFAVETNGTAISAQTNSTTPVSNGVFMVTLDYGPGLFTGTNYWLELGVRQGSDTNYTVLSPRQPLLPAPYAIFAASAGSAATADNVSSVAASQITGTIPLAQFRRSSLPTIKPI